MNERVRILWKERSKKSSAAAKTKGEGSRRTEEGGGLSARVSYRIYL